MPRKPSIPSYCRHKKSGNAFVRLKGSDGVRRFVYLGRYGSAESKEKYERVVAEHLALRDSTLPSGHASGRRLTMTEVMVAYLRHAANYYVKDGRATSELPAIKAVLKRLREQYSRTYADEFGPKVLKTVRQQMISEGMLRGVINQNVGRIKRMFRWAASEELVATEVWQSLTSVDGLRRGRSGAKESKPVAPVKDAVVDRTLGSLSPKIAAMVKLQRLLGCRPHEVCELRVEDFVCGQDVWVVHPGRHKTEHHDRDRVIMVGPKAQEVIRPYFESKQEGYVFESRPGRCYTHNSYRKAIQRGCERAGGESWAPNQLRHSKATELRAAYGIDTASAVLGHAGLKVTEIYAEKDFQAAMRAAREAG